MGVVEELDVDSFSQKKVETSYPYFLLQSVNEVSPVVVGMLVKGNIPLVGIHKGVKKILKYISPSAYNVEKLLRTHQTVDYVMEEHKQISITKVSEYLEVVASGSIINHINSGSGRIGKGV